MKRAPPRQAVSGRSRARSLRWRWHYASFDLHADFVRSGGFGVLVRRAFVFELESAGADGFGSEVKDVQLHFRGGRLAELVQRRLLRLELVVVVAADLPQIAFAERTFQA